MPAIEFDTLDVEQGFNFKLDVQKNVGHMLNMKIGETKLAADIKVKNPLDTKNLKGVVGILASVTWNSGHGDPFKFKFNVSTPNKQAISKLLHEELSNTAVEFDFKVWEYDPAKKKWYEAFYAADVPLCALVEKEGDKDLQLKVGKTPFDAVKSPLNWEIEMGLVPQTEKEQAIGFRTAHEVSVAKKWGIAVG